jgi:hypothetical protein
MLGWQLHCHPLFAAIPGAAVQLPPQQCTPTVARRQPPKESVRLLRILECGDSSPLFSRADGARGSSLVSVLGKTHRVYDEAQKAAMNRRTPKTDGSLNQHAVQILRFVQLRFDESTQVPGPLDPGKAPLEDDFSDATGRLDFRC